MLKSLQIINFRLFEHLKVEPLGRVNLIAGMNNSGKTALLEALRIWASDGDDTVINACLKARGEFTPGWIESYEALFYPKDENNLITINDLKIHRKYSDDGKLVNFIVNEQDASVSSQLVIISINDGLDPNVTTDYPKDGCIYIPFAMQSWPLEQLWKDVTLTDDADAVVEIVQQAEPRVLAIDVRADGIKVRLKEHPKPVSMGRLGDGVIQTLKIGLGLVNARRTAKKLLLIDEIEAGLHHSVLELLWGKIFHYALKWDLQVFATTHSRDAIRTFAEIISKPEYEHQGRYFRLERDASDNVKAVVYDMEQLTTSLEYDLETR